VKRSALSDYRGVYFAMHDLVADEIKGLAERSLVLTLPKEPTDNDDSLLTASEVAQLKLNSAWRRIVGTDACLLRRGFNRVELSIEKVHSPIDKSLRGIMLSGNVLHGARLVG
jgi:hypothetical protein